MMYSQNCQISCFVLTDIFLNYHSLSGLDSMWDVMELLNDMLQAVDPGNHEVCAVNFLP
jgi:hypothetical protein